MRNFKRRYSDSQQHTLSPLPWKKRKQIKQEKKKCIVNVNLVRSKLFSDKLDQRQSHSIFTCLQQLACVPVASINQEIAEYATGRFEICANIKCSESISVLHQHESLRQHHEKQQNIDELNNYFHRIGFKFDSHRYFCALCMDDAVFLHEIESNHHADFDCAQDPFGAVCTSQRFQWLHFKPACLRCDSCHRITSDPQVAAQCHCHFSYCGGCRCAGCQRVFCTECWGLRGAENWNQCGECSPLAQEERYFCDDCVENPVRDWPAAEEDDGRERICHQCYKKEIVKCDECQMQCTRYHASQYEFWKGSRLNTVEVMMLECMHPDCEQIVCLNCNEEQSFTPNRPCDDLKCIEKCTGVLCKRHRGSNQALCALCKRSKKLSAN